MAMFVRNMKHLHDQIALTSTNVSHAIVIIVSYKKLVRMFLEIHSVYKKLASLIWKTCFLKAGFYCTMAWTVPEEVFIVRNPCLAGSHGTRAFIRFPGTVFSGISYSTTTE